MKDVSSEQGSYIKVLCFLARPLKGGGGLKAGPLRKNNFFLSSKKSPKKG